VLAITRQESNFDVAAQSPVGARGLMQLMPPTATAVARANKVKYDRNRLTSDGSYNIQLGASYLDSLVRSFDGSYIMAAAGYNAGPSRPRAWARQFGDPRDPSVDPVDWVEQIPFSETRTYVQRVMENLMIYRAALSDTKQIGDNLEAELARRE
jgi:soluble lytic murein transglycosylase